MLVYCLIYLITLLNKNVYCQTYNESTLQMPLIESSIISISKLQLETTTLFTDLSSINFEKKISMASSSSISTWSFISKEVQNFSYSTPLSDILTLEITGYLSSSLTLPQESFFMNEMTSVLQIIESSYLSKEVSSVYNGNISLNNISFSNLSTTTSLKVNLIDFTSSVSQYKTLTTSIISSFTIIEELPLLSTTITYLVPSFISSYLNTSASSYYIISTDSLSLLKTPISVAPKESSFMIRTSFTINGSMILPFQSIDQTLSLNTLSDSSFNISSTYGLSTISKTDVNRSELNMTPSIVLSQKILAWSNLITESSPILSLLPSSLETFTVPTVTITPGLSSLSSFITENATLFSSMQVTNVSQTLSLISFSANDNITEVYLQTNTIISSPLSYADNVTQIVVTPSMVLSQEMLTFSKSLAENCLISSICSSVESLRFPTTTLVSITSSLSPFITNISSLFSSISFNSVNQTSFISFSVSHNRSITEVTINTNSTYETSSILNIYNSTTELIFTPTMFSLYEMPSSETLTLESNLTSSLNLVSTLKATPSADFTSNALYESTTSSLHRNTVDTSLNQIKITSKSFSTVSTIKTISTNEGIASLLDSQSTYSMSSSVVSGLEEITLYSSASHTIINTSYGSSSNLYISQSLINAENSTLVSTYFPVLHNKHKSVITSAETVGISLAVVFLIILMVLLFCLCVRKRNQKRRFQLYDDYHIPGFTELGGTVHMAELNNEEIHYEEVDVADRGENPLYKLKVSEKPGKDGEYNRALIVD
ncbi:mucin-3B isoform X4 [Hydra vulgaris]